jgi:hypothetical protein
MSTGDNSGVSSRGIGVVFQRVVKPDERISSLSACHGALGDVDWAVNHSERSIFLLVGDQCVHGEIVQTFSSVNTSASRATAI